MDLSVQHPPVNPPVPKLEWTSAGGEIRAVEGEMTLEAALLESAKVVLPQILQRVTAEALEAAWERLEQWQPAEGKTPVQNSRDLQVEYLNMKAQITALEPPDPALQADLLTRLEAVVEGHIERLLTGQYGPLTAFLQESGQGTATLAVKNSLLLFVLGRLSPQKPAWPRDFLRQQTQGRPVPEGGQATARAEDYGMVHYGPGGKTDVRPRTEQPGNGPVGTDRGEPAGQSGVVITHTAKRDDLPQRFPKPFTPSELEASNTFARHLRRYGVPGPAAEPGYRPEPGLAGEPAGASAAWAGVKAGVLWLKGQQFAALYGVGKSIAQVMQNGVERQISTVIRQASGAAPGEVSEHLGAAAPPRRGEPTRLEAVFLPFRAVVAEFRAHRDPRRALMSGLFHLLDALKQVEQADEPGAAARTKEPAGDQSGPLWTQTERAKRWLRQVKQSWDQFQRDMGLWSDSGLDLSRVLEDYSAWACTLPPRETVALGPKISLPTLLGWCALAAAGAAVVLALLVR